MLAVGNPVTADVNWLIVACLVEIDELIEVKAAPDSVPIDADASVATPVTPNVPLHATFVRAVVSIESAPDVSFRGLVIDNRSCLAAILAWRSVKAPPARVPIVAVPTVKVVAVVAWRGAVDPVATAKLLLTVGVIGVTVNRG